VPGFNAHNRWHLTFWQLDAVVTTTQTLRPATPYLSASIQELVPPTPLVLPAGELPRRIGIRTVQFERGTSSLALKDESLAQPRRAHVP
jgi:hypothetical protein